MRAGRIVQIGNSAALVAIGILLAGGCLVPAQNGLTEEYAPPAVSLGTLEDERISEASGLVASRANPGYYYVHNDSGGRPRVFLIDSTGRTRTTIRMRGAVAVDYEDIALAPGKVPGTWDVCVADIGDNDAKRTFVVIYRFPEITLSEATPENVDVAATAYRMRYADGPADAEALVVHPQTGDAFILTKRLDRTTHVYRLKAPWSADSVTDLPRIASITLPALTPLDGIVTAADWSHDGQRLAVRCYLGGWEWRWKAVPAADALGTALKETPVRLPLPLERQGEALAYDVAGEALLTVSEGPHPALMRLGRASPSSQPASVSVPPAMGSVGVSPACGP